MINGFDSQTAPLNEYEEKILLPIVIAGLKTKLGKAKAATNAYIIRCLNSQRYKINAVRLRKIINFIRNSDMIPGLIATSEGYYIATDEQELLDYEESLKGREDAIRSVRQSIERQRKKLFAPTYKQLNLFTK